jgi:hypothetical protein
MNPARPLMVPAIRLPAAAAQRLEHVLFAWFS